MNSSETEVLKNINSLPEIGNNRSSRRLQVKHFLKILSLHKKSKPSANDLKACNDWALKFMMLNNRLTSLGHKTKP